ncbi:murein L,D-transpeptidase catalytic domain family protein [Bdellovibrio reynosensis]|uniref:Murein L,D-transpeptidase catalytic domain family protein n=1 Tax=Bdellovibrio reynosensis TaxID=2835041 RepID=A0ABY4C8P9_9BACT|nr:murein L,D-transpeptidase catalytic domain family protein [Bdellovibrio reynosensis]UOF01310.1 murein L,D-transpeptidase catalytic domain family protein [Bdellovibrio reynosensis]
MQIEKNKSTLFSRFSTALLIASFLTLGACAGADEVRLPDELTDEPAAAPDNDTSTTPVAPVHTVPENQREAILKNYDYVDPTHIVPYKALSDALVYFHENKSKFTNQDYVSVINFAESSKNKRFFIINMKTGSVWAIRTSHGKGSDSDHDGYAEKFSNVSGSNASSLGFYKAAESYYGSNGLSLRMDGLSSTNSRARSRAIVIHGASYVREENVIQGRSWGCPAVSNSNRDAVVKFLKGGSLVYAVLDKGGTKRPEVQPSEPSVPSVPSTPTTPPDTSYKMLPLAWESPNYPERTKWSEFLMKDILESWPSLLNGANDMRDFCPRYNTLDNNQKANVWAQLFVAMAKYESAYSPVSRMHETTMGTDPVTKKPVYSEGLLQLSYQDIQWAPFCKFDWSKDKYLAAKDPKKTILDPYINLHCGVGIMALQVKNKRAIKVSSGTYWAVIKPGGRYQQISAITSMVKSLKICQ